jgi:hypothetical protein
MKRSAKRRRRSQPFPWSAALWLALALNCAAGAFASPLTAIVRLRATGVPEPYHNAVETAAADHLKDRPAMQASVSRAQASLQTLPGVSRVDFGVNIFGSGLIEMTLEPAAACREDGMTLLLDGAWAKLGECPANLPLIEVEESAEGFGVIGSWLAPRAAQLCAMLALMPDEERRWTVRVGERGVSASPAGRSGQVDFGRLDEMEEKRDALARAMEMNPRLFARPIELDLAVPGKPLTREVN